MNSEHIKVLQRMANESWHGSPELSALVAAITSLSAPQPPADWLEEWANRPLNYSSTVGEYVDGVAIKQPPAEAQAVEWQVRLVRKSDESVFRDWFSIDKQSYESEKGGQEGDQLRCEYRKLYTAPPSAPVGVEGLARRIESYHWDVADKPVAAQFAAELRGLTQQPAAVDGAWLVKARELYDRCSLFPENTTDGFMALLELRNHVHSILAAQPGGSDNDR